jgi:hypothetical protein
MPVAPYNLSGGRAEPYCSLDEVKFSATASVIDFTNLVENGSQTVQDRALHELIVRASSKIDVHCMGVYGTLNATSETENGRIFPNRLGQFVVHPTYKPILEVTSFSVGWTPGSALQDIPLTANNCAIERDQFIITSSTANSSAVGVGLNSVVQGGWGPQQEFCQYTYVNGWANTYTTTSTVAGATAIVVTDATGIYPSQNITIWDGQNDEYVQVASSYVAGSTTVTFSAPLLYNHGIGVNVSTLPAVVKQACIHFVVALVKQRGQGGLVLQEIGEPVSVSGRTESSMADEMAAYDLLDEFQSFWGRI